MRKVFIPVTIFIVLGGGLSILWLCSGRQLSMFVDRFRTIQTDSTPIRELRYEGSGSGGVFIVNDLSLNLTPATNETPKPDIGTTKNDQLALSFSGKVFSFGPVHTVSGEILASAPPSSDEARLVVRHSILRWIEPFHFNFMTGNSPTWRRHSFYQITWKKASGAKLEMLWRYEQNFYQGSGWSSASLTRENSSGLIRIDLQLSAKD